MEVVKDGEHTVEEKDRKPGREKVEWDHGTQARKVERKWSQRRRAEIEERKSGTEELKVKVRERAKKDAESYTNSSTKLRNLLKQERSFTTVD